jgi:hypothetical protein
VLTARTLCDGYTCIRLHNHAVSTSRRSGEALHDHRVLELGLLDGEVGVVEFFRGERRLEQERAVVRTSTAGQPRRGTYSRSDKVFEIANAVGEVDLCDDPACQRD